MDKLDSDIDQSTSVQAIRKLIVGGKGHQGLEEAQSFMPQVQNNITDCNN